MVILQILPKLLTARLPVDWLFKRKTSQELPGTAVPVTYRVNTSYRVTDWNTGADTVLHISKLPVIYQE